MKVIILLVAVLKFSSTETQNLSPKIVGGHDALENEFPYVVSIRRAELELIFGEPYHICGGSIINYNTVITASHCLYDPFENLLTKPGSYFVVAGFLRMYTDVNIAKTFIASEIYSHPGFNTNTLDNDIAIIKVAPSFTFDLPSIQPISIDFNQELNEGLGCSVHGWGTLSPDYPLYPDNLQTVDLKISNFDRCNKTYEGTITKNHICAYEVDKDSCSGDSGGPFVCNNKLVGIVSFGYSCALPDIPGVYTKVKTYRNFIENYENFKTSSAPLTYHIRFYCLILFSLIFLQKA